MAKPIAQLPVSTGLQWLEFETIPRGHQMVIRHHSIRGVLSDNLLLPSGAVNFHVSTHDGLTGILTGMTITIPGRLRLTPFSPLTALRQDWIRLGSRAELRPSP